MSYASGTQQHFEATLHGYYTGQPYNTFFPFASGYASGYYSAITGGTGITLNRQLVSSVISRIYPVFSGYTVTGTGAFYDYFHDLTSFGWEEALTGDFVYPFDSGAPPSMFGSQWNGDSATRKTKSVITKFNRNSGQAFFCTGWGFGGFGGDIFTLWQSGIVTGIETGAQTKLHLSGNFVWGRQLSGWSNQTDWLVYALNGPQSGQVGEVTVNGPKWVQFNDNWVPNTGDTIGVSFYDTSSHGSPSTFVLVQDLPGSGDYYFETALNIRLDGSATQKTGKCLQMIRSLYPLLTYDYYNRQFAVTIGNPLAENAFFNEITSETSGVNSAITWISPFDAIDFDLIGNNLMWNNPGFTAPTQLTEDDNVIPFRYGRPKNTTSGIQYVTGTIHIHCIGVVPNRNYKMNVVVITGFGGATGVTYRTQYFTATGYVQHFNYYTGFWPTHTQPLSYFTGMVSLEPSGV